MERTEAAVAPSRAVHAEMLRVEIERRGALWVRAEGGSMWPTIHAGDDVLLAPISTAPRTGDVILVDTGVRLLLHRVRRVGDGCLTTSGDACTADDAELGLAQVVALARASRRGARLTPLAPSLRFGIPALLRWAALRARLFAARAWRRIRMVRRPRLHALTPP
jgi:hypothetical protein